ncbi:hypothetical protein IWW57_000952 [Coemansia sp. S610]|nr:hypothetical protein IWW57_000952 [Coemansia sp. S610]
MEWDEPGFGYRSTEVDDKLDKTLYEILIENGSDDGAHFRRVKEIKVVTMLDRSDDPHGGA